jgi:type I restriction enzyme, S subunit
LTSNNTRQKVRLGDLAQNMTINEYEPLENGLTKYVAGDHLESKKLHITRFGDLKIDKEVIGSAFHRRFSSGDVLFGSRRAYLRKTGIATFDGLCSNTTLVIRKKSDELVDGILPFIFRLGKFTEHAVEKSTGSVTPYVLWRNLENFTFYLPPKSEQLKIKELLWTLQTSIDNLEKVLEKTKNYMVSRRESLLTQGIGHTKFKKVPWLFEKKIKIPEAWEIKKLNEVGKPSIGLTYKPSDVKLNGILVLRSSNILNSKLKFEDNVYVNKNISKKLKIKQDDLLICVRNGSTELIGKCALIDKNYPNMTFGAFMSIFRSEFNQFIFHQFSSNIIKSQIKRIITSQIKQLTNENLNSFRIIFPPLSEQQKITSILSNIDKQITQQQSHLTNLYTLQDSILNSKLTKEKTNVTN